ncbi:MAG: hypothetical protein ISR50_18940 [Alphaproteobacteria bacterium]|nr:hypothetical protein [Alphaproteobacteria bacterium]
MATKPTTKTDTKTKKAESATPKPEAVKADSSTAEAPAATSDADSGSSDGGSSEGGSSGGKKSSAPSRPISYFSSVSTDDYRAGWDDIFRSGGKTSTRKPVKSAAKRNSKLPANITLDADDLDAATREQLEAVFRQHAKKQRLNYDKLAKNGQVSWQISCRISNS